MELAGSKHSFLFASFSGNIFQKAYNNLIFTSGQTVRGA